MPQIIPSVTDGGLTRAAENFVRTVLERRRLALQERQLDQQRMVDATNTLVSFLPLMPEGAKVGDFPSMASLVKTAIPEAGDDIDLWSLNKETFAEMLDTVIKNRVESGEFSADDLERIIGVATGLGPSTGEERERGGEITAVQQEQQLDTLEAISTGFRDLVSNPEFREDITRTSMGLDQVMRFTDPLSGRDMEFSSEAAGGVWASLMRIWADAQIAEISASVELRKLDEEEMKEAREQLYKLAESLGTGLSTTLADQMLRAYQEQLTGDYEEGEGPFTALFESFNEKAQTGDQQAIDAMTIMAGFYNVVRNGPNNMFNVLSQSMGGMELLKGLALASALQDAGWPKDEIPGELGTLIRSFDRAGIEIGLKSSIFHRNRFSVRALNEIEAMRDRLNRGGGTDEGGSPDLGDAARAAEAGTVSRVAVMIRLGVLSEDVLRERFGDDIVDQAKAMAAGGG